MSLIELNSLPHAFRFKTQKRWKALINLSRLFLDLTGKLYGTEHLKFTQNSSKAIYI